MSDFNYQIGGSLPNNAPSYIPRAADESLYQALKAGEFCYIFNSRQMGKSSLLVRVSHQLQQEDTVCLILDMSRLGSETLSPQQWYKSIVVELWEGLDRHKPVDFKVWWNDLGDISLPLKLGRLIDLIALTICPDRKLVIFVDEIDSILNLRFSVDDFFALIRSFYNQRSLKPAYKRLTFALFGVTTPSDLIQDRQKTPFNIGQAIALQGFQLHEAQPLAQGFINSVTQPQSILTAVLGWTSGQPFLTQKLCQIVQFYLRQHPNDYLSGHEDIWVEQIVRSHVIQHWEPQDEPEHLRTIRDRIERNGNRVGRILGIYQQVLTSTPGVGLDGARNQSVPTDDSQEQSELLLSGLVVKSKGALRVKNRLYAEVFNLAWTQARLNTIRPYSQMFEIWMASDQRDDSRLLRGQALRDAQAWAEGKSLSDLDYQFIAKSEAIDRKIALQAIELERTQAIADRLTTKQKNLKLQRTLLSLTSLALIGFSIFGFVVWRQNQTLALREIEAIATSSEALLNSGKDLEAMIAAIKATRKLESVGKSAPAIAEQVQTALRRAAYQSYQYNSFSGHSGTIRTLAYSPDGKAIASASVDNTAKIWHTDGRLMATLTGHEAAVSTVDFSPDGKTIVTASEDNTAKVWRIDGTLITTLKGHTSSVWGADFSPDGQLLVTCSGDRTLKLWQRDGTLIKTFKKQPSAIFAVSFSPDGKVIASANASNTLDVWTLDGNLQKSLDQESRVNALDFSPDGMTIATATAQGSIKLWTRDGNLTREIAAHAGETLSLDFSPDSQYIVSGSNDKTVKLWQRDGTLLKTYKAHGAWVYTARMSPDGKTLASAGEDNIVRLWRVTHPLAIALNGHRSTVMDVGFSPDGKTIATASKDSTVKLWQREGGLLKTIRAHNGAVSKAIFSPDGSRIATASEDGTVKLWQIRNGDQDLSLIHTLNGHQGGAWGGAFSPDGEILAISSGDGAVKLWQRDGTLARTLKGHTTPVWAVTFSDDGDLIATASGDGITKLWQQNGIEIDTVTHKKSAIFGVAFSPNRSILATSSGDNTVKLWPLTGKGNVTKGKETSTLNGHTGPVYKAIFSPDGKILATASGDSSLRLWGTDASTQAILEKHNAGIMSVNFSPNGQTIATASIDQTALLWDLNQIKRLDLLAYSCDRVKDFLRTNIDLESSEKRLCD